jgi:serine protease Do
MEKTDMGIGEVGELLRRSTVHVRSADPRGQSAGSGVIWDSAGTIVTNAHVVGHDVGEGTHLVELWDGRSFPAEVYSRDDPRDLAKLKLPTIGVSAASLRTSPVKPGELAIAVGNPLGFTGALTTGVVHAVGPFSGFGRRPWVQAAIRLAPGNSGGPLADAAGHVIGINTMLAPGGIALAVPSAAVEEFLKNGPRPRLGVTIRIVRLPRRRSVGLLIMSIEPGSLAEQASLLIGDILIGTLGSRFTTAADLTDAIDDAIGDPLIGENDGRLKIHFLRGDNAREREVVISLTGRFAREAA